MTCPTRRSRAIPYNPRRYFHESFSCPRAHRGTPVWPPPGVAHSATCGSDGSALVCRRPLGRRTGCADRHQHPREEEEGAQMRAGIALGWRVHNERRWPGASSFLPSIVSTKSVVNRRAEKPVLSGKNWNACIRYIR